MSTSCLLANIICATAYSSLPVCMSHCHYPLLSSSQSSSRRTDRTPHSIHPVSFLFATPACYSPSIDTSNTNPERREPREDACRCALGPLVARPGHPNCRPAYLQLFCLHL
ncbi:hypothetical protein P154DRAFT_328211 [Amniculicola lignicola CBS 123094]|uniref:Secreted protein n=1 Tax=Amniculicola lignicola CBS 123094 TaxID=1392246 RepID=A0A6A5W541_9PLEO|nr:hypothetical protein P154DRAFT_328211 [Amniculicola lignicola CBS 123094]